MERAEEIALKILQIRNPNFMARGKWDVRLDGSYAEIVFAESYGDEDAVRIIIEKVDFVLDM